MSRKRIVILSGPSCVGKGPLIAALRRFYPEVVYESIPVIKSSQSRLKGPRPEEENIWGNPDYFRSEASLRALARQERYLVGECRGQPQAVDLQKIQESKHKLLLVEIYYTLGAQLLESTFLKGVEITTVFLSPVGRQEIEDLPPRLAVARQQRGSGESLGEYLSQIMLEKILARAKFQGKAIGPKFFADSVGRSEDTLAELKSACKYSQIIVNHDGEGHPNWHRLPTGEFTQMPEGDARRALDSFLKVLCKDEGAAPALAS